MEQGIIISSVALSNALKELNKVKVNKEIPITENVLLECTQEDVFLSKCNLQTTVKIKLDCEWNFAGEFLLTPQVGALMTKIDEQPVTVRIKDSDNTCVYVYGDDFDVKFEVDKADDYPMQGRGEFDAIGHMDYSLFRSTLEKLTPFLSTDEFRPNITGFYFDSTHAVATNGHMVRYIKHSEGNGLTNKDGIIITNILPYLPKPSKNTDFGEASFSISEDKLTIKIQFGQNDHIIYSRLIDEKYPDYRSVIPTECNTEFVVNNLELKKVIDQALLFANKTTRMVEINVNGQLEIRSEDLDFNTEFGRQIEHTDKSGGDILFAVNGSFLITCLKYLDDKVKFKLVEPSKAIIMNDEVLIMPLMIDGYV